MGWSLGWKVNEWARLREGNHSLMLLDNQLRLVETVEINYSGGSGVYANMFNATPFQIDGNFGITAGIAEMLLLAINPFTDPTFHASGNAGNK